MFKQFLPIAELPDEKLARISYALKDDTRRRIFWVLSSRPYSLSELLRELGFDKGQKPLICYHLRILRDAGLIEVDKETSRGNLRIKRYRLTSLGESLIYFIYRGVIYKESLAFKLFSKIFGEDYRLYTIYKATVFLSTILFVIIAGIILVFFGNLTVYDDIIIIKMKPLVAYIISLTFPAIILTLAYLIIFKVRNLRRLFGF